MSSPRPIGATALTTGATAAADVLVQVARLAGENGLSAQALVLRARIEAMAEWNEDAYAAALAVRAAVAELAAGQRDFRVGRAYTEAAEPPLALARAAGDLAGLACEVAAVVAPDLQPDVAVAATLAAAAAHGAARLVAANLTAFADDPRVVEATQIAAAAVAAAALLDRS